MVGLDFMSAMMTPVNKLLIVVMASVPDPDPDPAGMLGDREGLQASDTSALS